MDSIILSIDTKLIKNKKSISEFVYELPNKVTNAISITLSSIEIPNSIYVFNSKRNNEMFYFTFKKITYRFYLKQGNYDLKELYDEIAIFFNNIETKLIADDYTQIYFSFDINTARFKIGCNQKSSIIFANYDDYYSLGRLLGFAQPTYDDVTEIIGEYIPDIIGDKYIFMKMNNFGNILHNNTKYFSKIIINKESYEMIYNSQHKYITKKFQFNQPTNISKLYFRFEDYMGSLVSFNGLDLSFTLEIKFIKNIGLKPFYEKFNYDEDLMRMILMDSMMKYYQPDDNKLSMYNQLKDIYNNN